MANNYYTRQHDYLPLSIARGDSVQEDFQSVEVGFDKLPHPRVSGRGFGEAVVVGEGTEDSHALTKGQIIGLFDTKMLVAANHQGAWNTLTGALSRGVTVTHRARLWFLLVDLANVTTNEPGETGDWLALSDHLFDPLIATGAEVTERDGDGRIVEVTETVPLGPRVRTLNRDGNGRLESQVIEVAGWRRTETITRDGDGRFESVTVMEESIA